MQCTSGTNGKANHPALTTPAGPVGWYVHLPFCPTKCGYCDFYSVPTRADLIPDLTRAICREISLRNPGRPVASVFVGGGTPTVLPAEALEAVLRAIPAPPGEVEFSVEANPSTADELKLGLLRRCGVNRLSFGAQSFHRDELAVLERLHDPATIPAAVRLARAAGFDNVNLDLIFGVPGQTMRKWEDSLTRALALEPEHIACYSLMYEEGTALTRRLRSGAVTPIDEELEADMYERTINVLSAAGYEHYEISNFARPGRRCRHNLIYWRNEQYLGIGPSAVSYMDGVRRKNVADLRRYIDAVLAVGESPDDAESGRTAVEAALTVESEALHGEAHARETAIQMLRLTEGIERRTFAAATGFDAACLFSAALAAFAASGHIAITPTHLRLTRAGLLVANAVMREFLAPPSRSVNLPVLSDPPTAADAVAEATR